MRSTSSSERSTKEASSESSVSSSSSSTSLTRLSFANRKGLSRRGVILKDRSIKGYSKYQKLKEQNQFWSKVR